MFLLGSGRPRLQGGWASDSALRVVTPRQSFRAGKEDELMTFQMLCSQHSLLFSRPPEKVGNCGPVTEGSYKLPCSYSILEKLPSSAILGSQKTLPQQPSGIHSRGYKKPTLESFNI